ncbi:MAG: metallophosphoesterase [Proteobacteria bacterium]|nr:metallophosphoesterase [Pseudomonadota bacterium]
MKIHILNDLHIEFGDFELQDTNADVVVFAGDIGVGTDGLKWIEDQKIDKPVIYVLGNHEYYHHEIGLIDEIKVCAPDNIYVLNDDVLEIDGVRFLGSTLWTDFLIFGEAEKYFAIQHAKRGMADFEVIKLNGRRFTPEDSIRLHEQSRDWLECMLSIPFEGKTVVVTHHLPSSKSVHTRFSKDMLTPAFASKLEELMAAERVALWVHGHTHDAYDYELYGTRVVCNPRGYFGYERVDNFRPDFVVEI